MSIPFVSKFGLGQAILRRRPDKFTVLVIPHRLLDLFAGVHHEGAMLHDGFTERPRSKQNKARATGTGGHFNPVARR
jgi:hypothetical protein